MQYIGLLGIMIMFVVAITNSKFGGNFKFDAEARPTIEDIEPIPAPENISPEEFVLKCTREEPKTEEPILKSPNVIYERKQQK